jgi:hypothetical protein
MANNIYGTVRQAYFNPSQDADIYYHYIPSRGSVDTSFNGFKKIENVNMVLEPAQLEVSETGDLRLPGMYTLKLPVNIFGNKGIYTLYIVPKEIRCQIKDIGVLSAYPDIKGVILDTNDIIGIDRNIFGGDNLVGYYIEYFDGGIRQDYFRIITTSTFCEPITQNLATSTSNSNGYRYNVNGSLVFLTVTPSTTPSFKTNAQPYIGVPNQEIVIKNSKFDPLCVEIEVSDHDIETVSYMLEGEQIRNFENGRVTTYNFDGEIYKQVEYSTIKDNYTKTNIAEVKLDKSDNIDNSLNLESIKG